LKRLGVERIDLYQLHTPDGNVPYEESVGALKEMQQAGKIRYVGVSRVSLDQFRRARQVLGDLLVSVQNCYNVFYHQGYKAEGEGDNEEILNSCEREELAFIAWAPLADGALDGQAPFDRRELDRLADKYQASPQQIMLAALLKRSSAIIAIPGTRSLEHLKVNLAAERIQLEDAEDYGLWGWMRPVGLASMRRIERLQDQLRRPVPNYSAADLGDWRPTRSDDKAKS
jgi:aryl-alcohol dehydrogenase-like predicted oxidoreductase